MMGTLATAIMIGIEIAQSRRSTLKDLNAFHHDQG